MHHGIRLQGAMDELDLEHCCREHNIQLLVDAAHPFAIQLHQSVEKVAHTLNLLVIRFERIYPPRDEEHITWCDDFEDTIRQIRKEDIFTLLALIRRTKHCQAKAPLAGKYLLLLPYP